MPFRHAHWYMLLLVAITVAGFWSTYFTALPDNSWAMHVHGVTASLWILLVAAQSWTIAHGRLPAHRLFGRASLVVFPLFFAGMFGVLHTMAAATVPQHPFYRLWGAKLGIADILATVAVGWLYLEALRERRSVQQHSRLMLATPLFLALPALGRAVNQYVPGLTIDGPPDFWKFGPDVHVANIVIVAFTLVLYARGPRHGRAFAVAAAVMVAQSIAFEAVAPDGAWARAFATLGRVPAPAMLAAGLAVGAALSWFGWHHPRYRAGRPPQGRVQPA